MLREKFAQAVGHFPRNVTRNLLNVRVALQVTSRYVQRDVRRVDHAVQQGQELRHDPFDRIGHEHLIRIELYFVLLNLEIVPYLREIKDTGQVERIVDVQVNVEQRILGHRIERPVKLHVILLGNVGRLFRPQRIGRVDNVVLVGIHVFTVFPLLFFAESDRHGQEAAIFLQYLPDPRLVGEFLAVFAQVQDYVRTATTFRRSLLHRVFGRSVAGPVHRFGTLLVRTSHDLDLVGNHESGIEPQSEMPYNRLVFIFFQKFFGARKSDLVDIFVDLFGRHADPQIGNRQYPFVGIERYADRQIAQFPLEFAHRCERFQLLGGVYAVRNQLAQKNFMIGIEKFFNNRKDIFRCNSNFPVLHSFYRFKQYSFLRTKPNQLMCQHRKPDRLSEECPHSD